MKRFLEGDTGGNATAGASTSATTTLLSSTPATVAATAPTQAADSYFSDANGTFAPNWIDKLPEALRGEASLRVMPSLEKMAESYVATKKLVGTKLEAPGESATPEQVAAWRKTVGAPETPEGYKGDAKTVRPDAIPEEMWDANAESAFLAIAHKHHMPPGAVKEILDFYGSNIAQALTANKETETAVLAAEGAKLKQAWGADFDANLNTAQRVAVTVGLDPKTDPIFTNANVVEAFAKMGRLLSEDKLVKGDTIGIATTLADRAREMTDPKSQSEMARAYRGEFGADRQMAAQAQLHQFYTAANQK